MKLQPIRTAIILGGTLLLAPSAHAVAPVNFQRDIRPLLSDACFRCHGPDEGARKGKLRLDTRDFALKGGKSGDAAIVPGKPADSEFIRRIISADAKSVMPPPNSAKKLTPAQIELLKRWVSDGAGYQPHWAFVPPRRPEVPKVRDAAWVRNPIDAFVLARLEREGLKPSPEANREAVLRRLSLDLVGLPPTLAEIDAALADGSDAWFGKQMDRLLRSPHHGERWARHWLDAARYADSDGYEKDKPRTVWMYRDWVVNALNRDLGYDQFIIDQLAGDLRPKPTQDQLVATGFLRNSMINEEGGIDPEQFRMEAMFDRMDAIGKGVLGLTVQCAQCHTHKYDPLTQEEYYRMFAYLNDTHEANIAVYTPDEQQKRAELFRKMRDIEMELKAKDADWKQHLAAWEKRVKSDQPEWTVVKVVNGGDNSQRYVYHDDGSLTAWGYAPTKWTSNFVGSTKQKRITAFRLELLTDPNLPLNGPGRSPNGLFALSEFTVEVADLKKPGAKQKVKLVSATADFGNDERPLDAMYDDRTGKKRITGPVAFAIDGKDDTAWGIDAGPGRRNVDRKAVFVAEKPIELPEGGELTFYLKQMHGGWNSDDNQNNNLGRFRFSVTGADAPVADPLPKRIRDLLQVPEDRRTPAQVDALFSAWRTSVAEWKDDNAKIEELWKQHPEGAAQLTMLAREMTRETFVLGRGDFLKPIKRVEPGVPAVLGPLPANAEPNRLTLAKWMVDKNAPTTARSIVNRVWQSYFGTGLVSSSEDLGVQSESPTHAELLDWLAVEFMENGWSLKHLHRLIVTSATYRQSSKVSAALLQKDPDNRLLARGPRFRVEGELVRDIALAASGLLNAELGGAPVFPPAPDFLFKPPASYGPKVWKEDKGPNRYRRALYTFRFRSVPYPVLMNFDTPNGDASCVRRARSNTPTQALTTLNETVFLECARSLARKTLAEGGANDGERLVYAFRRCTARKPTDREAEVLLGFLQKQTDKFAAPNAKPWELAADDPSKPPKLPEGVTPAQAAAWTAVARLLLNLDETITKE
ncbi:MAG: PSD1 and planctomycete cytochrome C domain-containing protein [Gemmataceae bacterium]|nr:PSD1 and planctomycete cytochrome C domain-containing protein [Gemmataceae bacterium]